MSILTDRMRKTLAYDESFRALNMTMHSSVFCGVDTKYRLDIHLVGRFKSQIIKENHKRVWFKAYPWLCVTGPSRPPALLSPKLQRRGLVF